VFRTGTARDGGKVVAGVAHLMIPSVGRGAVEAAAGAAAERAAGAAGEVGAGRGAGSGDGKRTVTATAAEGGAGAVGGVGKGELKLLWAEPPQMSGLPRSQEQEAQLMRAAREMIDAAIDTRDDSALLALGAPARRSAMTVARWAAGLTIAWVMEAMVKAREDATASRADEAQTGATKEGGAGARRSGDGAKRKAAGEVETTPSRSHVGQKTKYAEGGEGAIEAAEDGGDAASAGGTGAETQADKFLAGFSTSFEGGGRRITHTQVSIPKSFCSGTVWSQPCAGKGCRVEGGSGSCFWAARTGMCSSPRPRVGQLVWSANSLRTHTRRRVYRAASPGQVCRDRWTLQRAR
jgi:hypothetical protein